MGLAKQVPNPAPATSFKRQGPITQVVGPFCFSASGSRGPVPDPGRVGWIPVCLRSNAGRRVALAARRGDAATRLRRPGASFLPPACSGLASRRCHRQRRHARRICCLLAPQAGEVPAVKDYARSRLGVPMPRAGSATRIARDGQPGSGLCVERSLDAAGDPGPAVQPNFPGFE